MHNAIKYVHNAMRVKTKKFSRDIAILESGELKGFRLKLGLSLKDMADRLGIAMWTLRALENDSRETRTTIARLAWYMVKYKEVKDKLDAILAKRVSPEEEEWRARRRKAWEEGKI